MKANMIDTYNVAHDLISRNLPVRAGKVAFIDDNGRYTFSELAQRVERFAGFLYANGLRQESRILLCLEDNIDFVTACLGAIKAGVIPVMINPLLTSSDFAYLLEDSRAVMLVTSAGAWPALEPVVSNFGNLHRIVFSGCDAPTGTIPFANSLTNEPMIDPAPTRADEACLWQYSSGSTGRPKGTIHVHGSVSGLLELFPRQILDLSENDVTFSAAKLFFGYGFGNGLVFPMGVGATSVLMSGRPTPDAVFDRLRKHQPTVFFGVPTLYQSMMRLTNLPKKDELSLRLCISAGESLPSEIGNRWLEMFGIEIIDGIGSTEMLHIFLSNKPGDVKFGTTGRPLDGIELRLLDDDGNEVEQGAVGELYIKGATSAAGYWAQRAKSRETFLGAWTRSGDKFRQDEEGRYVYCGRSDDMLKVSGIYVSPFEVENALMEHEAVLEAAVVGWQDDAGLIKPKAFVVLCDGVEEGAMAEALKAHVKSALAPYKYPRWFEFVEALPKTATGKIERYKLRP